MSLVQVKGKRIALSFTPIPFNATCWIDFADPFWARHPQRKYHPLLPKFIPREARVRKTATGYSVQHDGRQLASLKGLPFDQCPLQYLDWLVGQDWLYGEFKDRLIAYMKHPLIQRQLDALLHDGHHGCKPPRPQPCYAVPSAPAVIQYRLPFEPLYRPVVRDLRYYTTALARDVEGEVWSGTNERMGGGKRVPLPVRIYHVYKHTNKKQGIKRGDVLDVTVERVVETTVDKWHAQPMPEEFIALSDDPPRMNARRAWQVAADALNYFEAHDDPNDLLDLDVQELAEACKHLPASAAHRLREAYRAWRERLRSTPAPATHSTPLWSSEPNSNPHDFSTTTRLRIPTRL